MSTEEPLRVLVVDDSAVNRKSISEALTASPGIQIIGKAANGEEALRLALLLRPDVITLDLEMPRMDGFTFLRILMSRQPTPVIVVSSYSQKENVFKALELGALDFVAKPEKGRDTELGKIREELVSKVRMARALRPSSLAGRRRVDSFSSITILPAPPKERIEPPRQVIAVASSTGGPSALIEIFTRLPEEYASAVLVAQHMPDKFTKTFAERLDRRARVSVSEAEDLNIVTAGRGFVCPGRHCMTLEKSPDETLRLRVVQPSALDRYVPSADRLFESVAKAVGPRSVGVILTGMGDDGVEGARHILAVGGVVIAESEESAVVYGMPGAAVRAGVVSRSLPVGRIADVLASLGS